MLGIKGESVLSNTIEQCPVDYMHCVLEGITKKLMKKCWFEKSQRHPMAYSLHKHCHKIDEILLLVKPPNEFRRSPRSFEKSLNYWKASEYHAFLLFYSLPIF